MSFDCCCASQADDEGETERNERRREERRGEKKRIVCTKRKDQRDGRSEGEAEDGCENGKEENDDDDEGDAKGFVVALLLIVLGSDRVVHSLFDLTDRLFDVAADVVCAPSSSIQSFNRQIIETKTKRGCEEERNETHRRVRPVPRRS